MRSRLNRLWLPLLRFSETGGETRTRLIKVVSKNEIEVGVPHWNSTRHPINVSKHREERQFANGALGWVSAPCLAGGSFPYLLDAKPLQLAHPRYFLGLIGMPLSKGNRIALRSRDVAPPQDA